MALAVTLLYRKPRKSLLAYRYAFCIFARLHHQETPGPWVFVEVRTGMKLIPEIRLARPAHMHPHYQRGALTWLMPGLLCFLVVHAGSKQARRWRTATATY
jgi:hypothetical protein